MAIQDEATKQLGAIPFGNIIGGPLVAAIEAQAKAARSTVDFIKSVAYKPDSSGNPTQDLQTVTFTYQRKVLPPPAGTTPAGTTPAGTTPAGTTPAGTTPAGTTPAGTTPAGTTPAGTTPAGTTPAGTPQFVSTKIEVPLLVIVPIPYIRIDDMTINFKANISAESCTKDTTTSGSTTDVKGNLTAKYGWGPASVEASFSAGYSAKKDSTSARDSKYAVEYTMDIYVHAVQDDMPKGMQTILQLLNESIKPDK